MIVRDVKGRGVIREREIFTPMDRMDRILDLGMEAE